MPTLADIFAALNDRGALKANRAKDLKTSLRYLARALGHAGPEACPVDAALGQEATWAEKLEAHFATLDRAISAATRSNTRNNLRVVLRAAEQHGLLAASLPPQLLARQGRIAFRRVYQATAPYQTTYRSQSGPRRYGLLQAEWPPDIQAGWRAWLVRRQGRRPSPAAPMGVHGTTQGQWRGDQAHPRRRYPLRAETIKSYVEHFQCYFGYLAHVMGRTPTWENVFEVDLLLEFVDWHANRVGQRISAFGREVVIKAAAMAKVLGHPHADALAETRNALDPASEMHIKDQHMVTLAELEAIAEACLAEGRRPYHTEPVVRFPGVRRACRFQQGVILKLLVRIPLRQRNVREMQRGKHLYQDHADDWQLRFVGDDLKIGLRGDQPNTYAVNLSRHAKGWIPVLEEWLSDFRPRFPGADTSPYVFLTQSGRPFARNTLGLELSELVAMRTKGHRRFYPHLIRTIWATEFLKEKKDYATAAVRLGDTVRMVIKTYQNIVEDEQHAIAAEFIDEALRSG